MTSKSFIISRKKKQRLPAALFTSPESIPNPALGPERGNVKASSSGKFIK